MLLTIWYRLNSFTKRVQTNENERTAKLGDSHSRKKRHRHTRNDGKKRQTCSGMPTRSALSEAHPGPFWCTVAKADVFLRIWKYKNYWGSNTKIISTHHDDYAGAAIYPANCGLSFSLASCSLIFGKLKGQLWSPTKNLSWSFMLQWLPQHLPQGVAVQKIASLSGLPTVKTWGSLGFAALLRWNC